MYLNQGIDMLIQLTGLTCSESIAEIEAEISGIHQRVGDLEAETTFWVIIFLILVLLAIIKAYR